MEHWNYFILIKQESIHYAVTNIFCSLRVSNRIQVPPTKLQALSAIFNLEINSVKMGQAVLIDSISFW